MPITMRCLAGAGLWVLASPGEPALPFWRREMKGHVTKTRRIDVRFKGEPDDYVHNDIRHIPKWIEEWIPEEERTAITLMCKTAKGARAVEAMELVRIVEKSVKVVSEYYRVMTGSQIVSDTIRGLDEKFDLIKRSVL